MGCLSAGARSPTLREGCGREVYVVWSSAGAVRGWSISGNSGEAKRPLCGVSGNCWPCNAANLNEISNDKAMSLTQGPPRLPNAKSLL